VSPLTRPYTSQAARQKPTDSSRPLSDFIKKVGADRERAGRRSSEKKPKSGTASVTSKTKQNGLTPDSVDEKRRPLFGKANVHLIRKRWEDMTNDSTSRRWQRRAGRPAHTCRPRHRSRADTP
jgi:hypothetical protein